MSKEGKPLYSYDLKAATDRLPLEVQEVSLRLLFGKRVSTAWFAIMKELSYFTLLYGRPTKVSYVVGQGMGVLSSWSTLAVTHHVLVRFAAHRCGIRRFEDYLVLGDDIIIAGDEVSKSYLELVKGIGIEISIPKSVLPNSVVRDSGEFASRLIVGQTDYSPLPVGLILLRDLASQMSLMTHLVER